VQQCGTATWRVVAVLVLLLAGTACTPQDGDGVVWPTEGWQTATPKEQGMDPALLEQMMALVDGGRQGSGLAYDAILIVRHGYIVFEEYRNGYGPERKHHLQSATKSVSSMLIGIALHEGFLEGVDQKLVDLFPDHDIANLDPRKQRLTLEHLLTMSDGMDWHELDYAYTDQRNTLGQMWTSRDAVQHVLDQPMAREPGERWAYNSGTSILLGGILEQATGRDVLAFAREYLFEPLGIQDVKWDKAPGNHYHTDGGLYLTPRDMARFGYLALHGGTWDGKEIVSPEWVARSTETHYQASSGRGYGYQWWTLDGGAFAAHGHYEQIIYVVPAADLVVVLTGDIPDDVLPPSDGLLYRYILAACTDLPPGAPAGPMPTMASPSSTRWDLVWPRCRFRAGTRFPARRGWSSSSSFPIPSSWSRRCGSRRIPISIWKRILPDSSRPPRNRPAPSITRASPGLFSRAIIKLSTNPLTLPREAFG
jgi:CubicO group peptidase (beta-lactamase class C family)